MKDRFVHLRRVLHTTLFVLLLNVTGMTKGYAYSVIVSENVNGIVQVIYSNPDNDPSKPEEGDIVKLKVATITNPFLNWTVLDSNNNEITVTQVENENAVTFVMPASDVTVSVTFVKPYLFYTLFEDYQACEWLVPQREWNGIDDIGCFQLPRNESGMQASWYYQNGAERTTGFLALAQNEKEGFQVFIVNRKRNVI